MAMIHAIQSLIRQLAGRRKGLGVTQTQLGNQLGVKQAYISRLEKGNVDVRASTLIEIARLLGVEVMLVPKEKVQMVLPVIQGSDDENVWDAPAYLPDDEG